MRKVQSLPSFSLTNYSYSHSKGSYIKTLPSPEKSAQVRLPTNLIIQATQCTNIKCNATYVITSRDKKVGSNSYEFFTGLQETKYNQWFSGDDFFKIEDKEVKSLILFNFSTDKVKIKVYYFHGYYLAKKRARQRFINDAIIEIVSRSINDTLE